MSVRVRVQRYEYSNGVGPYLNLNQGTPPDVPEYDVNRYDQDIMKQPEEVRNAYWSEEQPHPGNDGMKPPWEAEDGWASGRMRFGFASSDERRRWFSEWSHKRMTQGGVQLVEYTLLLTDPEQLELGGCQLAFDPDTAIKRKVLA